MGSFDVGLGLTLLGLAALTGGLRVSGRTWLLGWLQPMREQLGEERGDAIHFFLYTAAPAILGACLLLIGVSTGG